MPSYSTIRLPKLKLTVKKDDKRLKNNHELKMDNDANKSSPYNLMNLLNRLPTLDRKSAKSNNNNNKTASNNNNLISDSDFVPTPPKTPQKPKTPKLTSSNDYYDRIPKSLRTTPRYDRTPRTPGGRKYDQELSSRKEKNYNNNNVKSKSKPLNGNNRDKKKFNNREDKKSKTNKSIRYGKSVPRAPVDTYVRPKTQTERSISNYVKLPPIQRAYTFATLRKHKQAASEFLAALRANYGRYDTSGRSSRFGLGSRGLSRSRSVLSVRDHIGRQNFARLTRSRSVADIARGRSKNKNNDPTLWTPRYRARSKSVDPDVGSRSRPRSRAASRSGRSRSRSRSGIRKVDKSVSKRSRSVSGARHASLSRKRSRQPLDIKQTRTSLARSKSLISIVSKQAPPSRGGSQQVTPRNTFSRSLRKTPSLPELRTSTLSRSMSRSMSRISLASAGNDGQGGKKKVSPLFVAIKPENQNSEKEKFLKTPNYDYSPQFTYANPPSDNQLSRFSRASDKYLHVAIKIMRNAIDKFGTYEKYMEQTGGRKISRYEITQAARRYLQNEGMETEVDVHLSEDLLSRARMCVMGGRPTVIVRAVNMRENWVEGMLRHEIGTHYIRAWNNKLQAWGKAKKRQELGLEPANPTEEGIASLHSVLFRKDPLLWRGALLYYTIYKASQMSFAELFKDLGQFVKDTEVRWEYCIRAKRGYEDTGQPGAFCKDQVYLNGALQILKYRNTIDFHMLVRCGKVSWKDVPKLERLEPEMYRTRIPKFMEDLGGYKAELNRILIKNGLTQEDLEFV